jgi:hypothetical protein
MATTPTRVFGNLRIYEFGNDQVAVVAHGGYTPKRGCIRTGSGKAKATIPIVFYSAPDRAAVNDGPTLLQNGEGSKNPADTADVGQETENYSLTNDEDFEKGLNAGKYQNPMMDYITVAPGKKAHLQDVLNAIKGKGYTKLHFVACRINKLTFDLDKLVISSPL